MKHPAPASANLRSAAQPLRPLPPTGFPTQPPRSRRIL